MSDDAVPTLAVVGLRDGQATELDRSEIESTHMTTSGVMALEE